MGHGIAEVAALSGYRVVLYDLEGRFLERGMDNVKWSLSKLVEKGSITEERRRRHRPR